MPRSYTPPTRLDIRKDLARDALALYADWRAAPSKGNAPELIGRLVSSLELLLEALEESGL